jgi:hypothetical protein
MALVLIGQLQRLATPESIDFKDLLESCNYDIDRIKEIRNMIRWVIPP